jgi:hypothetical protein
MPAFGTKQTFRLTLDSRGDKASPMARHVRDRRRMAKSRVTPKIPKNPKKQG